MVAANPQKLLGRNKKIQSEVDSQQQQLTASPINIAVSQNILDSLAKITELISQQNLQIVEIIKEVKQPKSVEVKPGPSIQPQQQLIAAPADIATLQDISKSLTKITQLLTQQNSQVTAEANQERKNQENAKRKKIELGLENSFAAVKNVAQAVVAPVKSILDQIIQFFVTLFLGKAILNLIDWFSKKENQSKIRSIARFLKDWWPALVAGYILFGTGFGRVVRNLASIGLRAIFALGGITLKLAGAIASALKFKKVGAAMSALGGGGGFKGIAARLLTGAAVAGGTALVANKMMGGGDVPQVAVPEPASLPVAEAFGGGLIDFKTMLAASGGQVDSKLGIFTQLFGSGGIAGLLNIAPGVVSGPKGIDKVPAMLTDGEFVMSRGAVQKFGVSNLEAMNASGGGTNKPKIVQKRIHADGGGLIGENKEIRKNYDAQYGPGAYDNDSVVKKSSIPHKDTAGTKLNKSQPTFGPSAMPAMSTQADMNALASKIRFDERLKKVKGQMQVRKALASGKGVNIRGAGAGAQLGTGYSTTYQGKKSIVIKGGAKNFSTGIRDKEITLAGERYFAMKRGADVIYIAQDRRDVGGGGMFQPGGMLGGPRMSARSDYAASKGKYYSSADQKTYANENDAKSARKSRMTSLASQQRLIKLSGKGGTGGRSGIRYDTEMDAYQKDIGQRGGLFGQMGRGFTRMFGTGDQIDKINQQDKAATTKVKQAGAESIGRYYSSSDGKYYKDYNAADKAKTARKAKLATTPVKAKPITPTPKPAPKVYNPAGGGMGGRRGSGGRSNGTRIPNIPAGKDVRKTANQYNIK